MSNKIISKQQLIAEEQKKLFKNRKVVQLNKFIKGDVSPFTVNDLKIFKLIISKVDSKDSLFQDFYEITTDEIKHLNINEKHLYSETKKSLKRLANIYITFEEESGFREVGLIRNDFRFEKYSKKILINFNDDMSEYLINLKKNFFMYDLIDIVNFKFKHTLKFYEYLKSTNLNVLKLKTDTIKEILGLQNRYSRYTNFKKDVLEVIVDEINTCSNTLFLKFSEEKIGAKIEYIIFHVNRIKNDLLLEAKPIKEPYSSLYNKKCIYLKKEYLFEAVDCDDVVIILKEIDSDNKISLIFENMDKLEEQLEKLFPNDYTKEKAESQNINEIERLSAIKNFKEFRAQIIENYKGCEIAIEYLDNQKFKKKLYLDNETGYIKELDSGMIIPKEQSLEIWNIIYTKKDKLKNLLISKKDNLKLEINSFIDQVVYVTKNDPFGNKESIKYKIVDIEELEKEEENKYRLCIKNEEEPNRDIEKSKSLLTLEQIKVFVEENKYKKDYSFQNE